jgi:hypothetical protein
MRDLHDDPDDLAMPHFEDQLWDVLTVMLDDRPSTRRNGTGPHARPTTAAADAAADAAAAAATSGPGGADAGGRGGEGGDDRRARRGRRPRRRRPVVVVAAGLAAAAVLVVVALAWPERTDSGAPERVETIDLPDPQVVVSEVLQATEPGAGEPFILHETSSWGDGLDRAERWYDDVTFASRELTTTADGQPLTDGGWPEPPALDAPLAQPRMPEDLDFDQCVGGILMTEDGELHQCDTGEPIDTGLPPAHPSILVNHCSATYVRTETPLIQRPGFDYLRLYLETGDIVVDGTGEHGGRQLIRLRNHDGSYEWLVDPDTYQPVVATEPGDGSRPVTRTYERLPRTEENLALLTPPLPGDYAETSGDEALQDAIENPCADHPSDEAEPVTDSGSDSDSVTISAPG